MNNGPNPFWKGALHILADVFSYIRLKKKNRTIIWHSVSKVTECHFCYNHVTLGNTSHKLLKVLHDWLKGGLLWICSLWHACEICSGVRTRIWLFFKSSPGAGFVKIGYQYLVTVTGYKLLKFSHMIWLKVGLLLICSWWSILWLMASAFNQRAINSSLIQLIGLLRNPGTYHEWWWSKTGLSCCYISY